MAARGGRIQLHLGCGDKFIPGFIHIDARKFPHVDHVAPVDDLSLFKDGSVSLIYASHLLEHFSRHETARVLKEWNRALKRGGILRLAVPDFEAITARYDKTGDLDEVLGLLYGGQTYKENFHYTTFDFKRLSRLLKEAGFRKVERYDWRKTVHKDYDDFSQAYLPHMDKEHGTLMSLNVEATK